MKFFYEIVKLIMILLEIVFSVLCIVLVVRFFGSVSWVVVWNSGLFDYELCLVFVLKFLIFVFSLVNIWVILWMMLGWFCLINLMCSVLLVGVVVLLVGSIEICRFLVLIVWIVFFSVGSCFGLIFISIVLMYLLLSWLRWFFS